MAFGTNALNKATYSMATSYSAAMNSMALSLERVASGKRFTKASQDLGGYLKSVDLDIDVEKYERIETNLSTLGATLDLAIETANSVMDDLVSMKAAWATAESLPAGAAKDAATDLATGYQDSITESILLRSSDGKLLIDEVSAAWATETMAGGSTLTINLSGEAFSIGLGTEATEAETDTSISEMTSYIGKLEQYSAQVDSQATMAGVMRENTESVLSALTAINEAEELANYTAQNIRAQASVSMMAQANLARRTLALLYDFD